MRESVGRKSMAEDEEVLEAFAKLAAARDAARMEVVVARESEVNAREDAMVAQMALTRTHDALAAAAANIERLRTLLDGERAVARGTNNAEREVLEHTNQSIQLAAEVILSPRGASSRPCRRTSRPSPTARRVAT